MERMPTREDVLAVIDDHRWQTAQRISQTLSYLRETDVIPDDEPKKQGIINWIKEQIARILPKSTREQIDAWHFDSCVEAQLEKLVGEGTLIKSHRPPHQLNTAQRSFYVGTDKENKASHPIDFYKKKATSIPPQHPEHHSANDNQLQAA